MILRLTVKATVTPMLLKREAVSENAPIYGPGDAPINVVDVRVVPEAFNKIHPIRDAYHDRVHEVH